MEPPTKEEILADDINVFEFRSGIAKGLYRVSALREFRKGYREVSSHCTERMAVERRLQEEKIIYK